MQNILELCNCSVSVVSERFQCAGDNTAYLDITVDGFMAGNIKEFLENSQLTTKLDLQFATLYVCNDGSCKAANTMINNNVTTAPQGDDDSDNHNLSITAIIICFSVLTSAVICLIIALVLNRYVSHYVLLLVTRVFYRALYVHN